MDQGLTAADVPIDRRVVLRAGAALLAAGAALLRAAGQTEAQPGANRAKAALVAYVGAFPTPERTGDAGAIAIAKTDPNPPDIAGPSPEKASLNKDIFDKMGSFTTVISSGVIGVAGIIATYLYNNRQLRIKHLENQQEEARLSAQAKASSQVERINRLEGLYKFVASEDERERTFGYAMFMALGEEELATKLIVARNDKAGIGVSEGIIREDVWRYKSYLESVGFLDLQPNIRFIVFAENDVEGTVPPEFLSMVSSAVKNMVSFYFCNAVFIRNDLVSIRFLPLHEYTHYALYNVIKMHPAQTPIEAGLAYYYPASFLDLKDISVNGPARWDLSFLEDDTPRVSAQAAPISVAYQGQAWAGSFWECRQKLTRAVVDSLLVRVWIQSYQKRQDTDGAVDRFRDALLGLATAAQASCFREAFARRGLINA
jgi:hypothetical protein